VIRGRTGQGRVLSVDDAEVALALELDGEPPTPPRIDLVLALPRPKVLSRALEIAASFGVRRIDLVNAWRVDKSYFSSTRLAPGDLDAALIRGCEQGATTWLPELAIHRLLVPWFESMADLTGNARKILAHPGAARGLESALAPGVSAQTIVAVGPEGGWIESEQASFTALGFEAISIGPRVLRVEAALAALFAQIELVARLPAGLW
jgi:RsmE family RNA methyltransferase